MKQIALTLVLSLAVAPLAIAQEKKEEKRPAKLLSVVLSTVPEEKDLKIPVLYGHVPMHLSVPSSFYYLSKPIAAEREFADGKEMDEAVKAYCKELADKHEWTFKVLTKSPVNSDDGHTLGKKEEPTLRGLLTNVDASKKQQPAAVTRLIYTYQDTMYEQFVEKKDGKVKWDFVQRRTSEHKCGDK